MPTFTALALDSLIESGNTRSMAPVRNSYDAEVQTRYMDDSNSRLERRFSTPLSNRNPERIVGFPPTRKQERGVSLPPTPKKDRDVSNGSTSSNPKMEKRNGSSTTDFERKDHWTRISPALYAIPKSTPLPDSPSSFSPSPYVINHKRRGPRLVKSYSEVDVSTCDQSTENGNVAENGVETLDHAMNGVCDDNHVHNDGVVKSVSFDISQDREFEDLVDPQDSVSVRSIEGDGGAELSLNPATPIAEFYDAWEELSSESGNQLSAPHLESELRGIRLSLLMEIEKRKQAEETLNHMRNQWQLIASKLSDFGVSLPEIPTNPLDEEQLSEVSQQVLVARFLSESIGRGLARAETEMEMEAQINLKNTEISRLYDKLHYYETVNHEMSQRNQEIVETTRRARQRRKRSQKWIWGSIATVITVGSAYVLYSCLQTGKSGSSLSESPVGQVENRSTE